jgi:hypothetical protein
MWDTLTLTWWVGQCPLLTFVGFTSHVNVLIVSQRFQSVVSAF